MKMTKNNVKAILNGEYIDALAYFANRLSNFSTTNGMYNELERIDEKIWDWACDWDGDETDMWLRIYSGLMMYCED